MKLKLTRPEEGFMFGKQFNGVDLAEKENNNNPEALGNKEAAFCRTTVFFPWARASRGRFIVRGS
jgi:hypothetical protein